MKREDDFNYFVRTATQSAGISVSHCWQSDSSLVPYRNKKIYHIVQQKIKKEILIEGRFLSFFSHQRLMQTFYDVKQAKIGIVRSLFSKERPVHFPIRCKSANYIKSYFKKSAQDM